MEYKFKKNLPEFLMLDVVAETVIGKILEKAVKEFNMPQELSDKIWDGATEIIETLEKRMIEMFHKNEKFNRKLSSNSGNVALDWAYVWMAHWAAHEIGVKFPEARNPYLMDMTNKGLFFNNINQLLASIEEKMIIAMLKKGKTEKEVIEAFDDRINAIEKEKYNPKPTIPDEIISKLLKNFASAIYQELKDYPNIYQYNFPSAASMDDVIKSEEFKNIMTKWLKRQN